MMASFKPVGIGIIGAGAIAQGSHLPAYAKLRDEGKVFIVAVADANADTARTAAEKFGASKVFTDYREMFALPEIDAVDICTPNFLHKQPTLDAFAAGKHVFVEKPIGLNAIEGVEMVAAGHRAGKKLQVGFNLRFAAAPQAIKRMVDQNVLGDVYYARAHALRRRGVPSWGMFTQMDKQGGGPLIDIGVHLLDLSLWFMGHPEPLSVSGQAYRKFGNKVGVFNSFGPWDPKIYSVEDFAVGQVRFKNGATLTLESSYVANIAKNESTITLMGTEGGLFLDLNDNANTKIFREESGTLTDTYFPALPTAAAHELEIRSYVQAILDNTPVAVPGEQGLMVSQIIDAIYGSSETGREVVF
jgi:predicted dehydrogenase